VKPRTLAVATDVVSAIGTDLLHTEKVDPCGYLLMGRTLRDLHCQQCSLLPGFSTGLETLRVTCTPNPIDTPACWWHYEEFASNVYGPGVVDLAS
jgi:hypothetical protein